MRQLKITTKITLRESESLKKYFKEVSKIELLTAEQEVDLARKIKDGDDSALNKLVRSNLRFVISVAKQYQNNGLSLLDLINEGNVGLIKAARRFDETRGFKFISYAVWWIRQSITLAIAEQTGIVRFPLNKLNILNKINNMHMKLEQKLQRNPTTQELANELHIDIYEINKIVQNTMNHISMDAPFSDENDNNLYDILLNKDSLNPETNLIKESLQKEIHRILSSINEKEAKIIKLYFGLEGNRAHTLTEIGLKLNITKERVRQIKNDVIKTLKTKSDTLRQYL